MHDVNGVSNAGSAYIFELNQNTMEWEQVSEITSSDGSSGDFFGTSVSIDFVSGFAIIGAMHVGDDTGASYIFQRDNYNTTEKWNQMEKLIPAHNDTRYFGHCVFIYNKNCIVSAYGITALLRRQVYMN